MSGTDFTSKSSISSKVNHGIIIVRPRRSRGGESVSKVKPDANDLRRFIGYTMITFMSVFIFFPLLWFVHLFSPESALYTRWAICSVFLVVFNSLYYYWEYPKEWFENLLALVGVNLVILIIEYFWLMQSMS